MGCCFLTLVARPRFQSDVFSLGLSASVRLICAALALRWSEGDGGAVRESCMTRRPGKLHFRTLRVGNLSPKWWPIYWPECGGRVEKVERVPGKVRRNRQSGCAFCLPFAAAALRLRCRWAVNGIAGAGKPIVDVVSRLASLSLSRNCLSRVFYGSALLRLIDKPASAGVAAPTLLLLLLSCAVSASLLCLCFCFFLAVFPTYCYSLFCG